MSYEYISRSKREHRKETRDIELRELKHALNIRICKDLVLVPIIS